MPLVDGIFVKASPLESEFAIAILPNCFFARSHGRFRRGYAWDNSTTCVYGQLPSNILAAVGNFVPLSQVPAQLEFPYSSWLNNEWVGYVGQRLPTTAFFNLEVKL